MILVNAPGWPDYKVRWDGQILSLKGLSFEDREPRILKAWLNPKGYLEVCLSNNGVTKNVKVHRLVALAFHGECPPGKEVCHNDGNKLNNCAGNLRYDTHRANVRDAVKHGTHAPYEANRNCCDQGHEFTEENTGWRYDEKGKAGGVKMRRCKECSRLSTAKQRAKNQDKTRQQGAEQARKWRAKKKAEKDGVTPAAD